MILHKKRYFIDTVVVSNRVNPSWPMVLRDVHYIMSRKINNNNNTYYMVPR